MARPTKTQQKQKQLDFAPLPTSTALPVGTVTGMPASGRGPHMLLRDIRAPASYPSLEAALNQATDDLYRVRVLARMDPDTKTALKSLLALADTKLSIAVRAKDGSLSAEGTAMLNLLLFKMYNNPQFSKGFDPRPKFHQVVRSLLREIPLSGSCGAELVLDKYYLPDYIAPVSTATIKWKTTEEQVSATKNMPGWPSANMVSPLPTQQVPPSYKLVPYQLVMGHYTVLDIPTFFYSALDQDPLVAYSDSPFEADIKAAILYERALRDIHRVVSSTGHSRLNVSIDFEKLMQAMPQSVKNDPSKWEGWFESQRQSVQSFIDNLRPEQGIVNYSYITVSYVNSEIGAGADYSAYIETLDSRRCASLSTPAAILNKRMSAGSQNTTSSEMILYLKMAEAVQGPVAETLSSVFTAAIRLFGFDGYCVAKFAKPALRPDIEMAAFKSMDTNRILDLLSIGRISDEEAQELLDLPPLPPDAPRLSGTLFRLADQSPESDPTSNADPLKRAVTGNLPEAEPRNHG